MTKTKITIPQNYDNIIDEISYFEDFLKHKNQTATLKEIPKDLNPKNLNIPNLIQQLLTETAHNDALIPYLLPHLSKEECNTLHISPDLSQKRQDMLKKQTLSKDF